MNNILTNNYFKYNSTKRNVLIDILKGIAIFLVVIGHSIQYNTVSSQNNIIFKFIYSFHLPLFMFLSGYLAFKIKDFNFKLILKKFKGLVIPFLTWRILLIVPIIILLNYPIMPLIIKTLTNPADGSLWFLWILFLNFILLTISVRLTPILKGWSFVLIIVLSQFLPNEIFGFNLLKYFVIFFISGYLASKYIESIKRNKYINVFNTLILYLICILFLYKKNLIASTINLTPDVFHFIQAILIPFFSILLLFLIFNYIKKLKILIIFSWLGQYTIDIYVLSIFFINICLFLKFKTHFLVAFILTMAFSIIFSYIIRQFRITRILLLGQSQ